MSLILDALNKADREREYRDAVPDINTVHGVARPPRQRYPAWMIAALAAAVILVLVLLVILWSGKPAPASAPVEPAVPEAVVGPVEVAAQPEPANPTITQSESPPVLAALPDEEVRALYQTQQDTQVLQVIEPQIQPALTEQPTIITPSVPRASTVDEDLARALWEESKRELQQPVPDALLPKPRAAVEPVEPKPLPADLPLEETLAGHQSVPFLHELPVSVQNTIPTLMYAKHDYEKGFVVINKEELQMGSAAQGGVLLERILADGVLLSLNGTEFKLSSLSSWVNY